MKLSIRMLERRRALLHILLCFLYLVILLMLNRQIDSLSWFGAAVVLATGMAGLGVAYTVRYTLMLAFREGRAIFALLLLSISFFTIGVLGYLIFHGFDNRVSSAFVDPAAGQVLKGYVLFFIGWYLNFAKYGVIFYLFEKYLFNRLDKLLSRYWPGYIMPVADFSVRGQYEGQALKRNPLVDHFSNNLSSRVYSFLSDTGIGARRLNHLINLWDYGKENTFGPSRHLVPLEEEIAAVHHFLSMESEHNIDVRVSGDIQGVQIPPALLLSIAKNMVKHGAFLPRKMKAVLDIRVEDLSICIYSENGVANAPRWKRKDSGRGLQHIRQLLRDLYGNAAALRSGKDGDCFWLHVQIDNLKRYDDE